MRKETRDLRENRHPLLHGWRHSLRPTLPMNRSAANLPANSAGTAVFAVKHQPLAMSESIGAGRRLPVAQRNDEFDSRCLGHLSRILPVAENTGKLPVHGKRRYPIRTIPRPATTPIRRIGPIRVPNPLAASPRTAALSLAQSSRHIPYAVRPLRPVLHSTLSTQYSVLSTQYSVLVFPSNIAPANLGSTCIVQSFPSRRDNSH
jgi:hypothetical protein